MKRTDRMPTIEFSNEADYGDLFTVLADANFVYHFVLADGTVHTGRFLEAICDDITVAIYQDGTETEQVVRFNADALVKAVYL